MWQGTEFITVDHEDVKTNEWIAWSMPAVGTPQLELFDADGDALLFTKETTHTTVSFEQVPKQQMPVSSGSNETAAAAFARRLVAEHTARADVGAARVAAERDGDMCDAGVAQPSKHVRFNPVTDIACINSEPALGAEQTGEASAGLSQQGLSLLAKCRCYRMWRHGRRLAKRRKVL